MVLQKKTELNEKEWSALAKIWGPVYRNSCESKDKTKNYLFVASHGKDPGTYPEFEPDGGHFVQIASQIFWTLVNLDSIGPKFLHNIQSNTFLENWKVVE